jgi:MFS family permease
LRWLVLVALSLPSFASAYLYDCVGPLAKLLSAQLGYSNADIGLLQAVCSLPNLVMVLIGGIIIDRIGERRSLAIFAWLCLAGAVVTALSPRLGVMVSGRLLYGLGSGSLGVAINTGIAKWFRGQKLSFAFGVMLTISRLGSLASQTSPAWAHAAYRWWRGPLLMALLAGVLCVAAAGVYGMLESRAGRAPGPAQPGPGPEKGPRKRFTLGDLRFNRSYWLVVLLCVCFYAGIFPFQTFAQKFFIEARGTSTYRASLLVGIPTVIAMAATPLFGLLADRIGRRSLLMLLGTALLAPCYLLLAYGRLPLALPMVLMGIAFALVPAVMWPAVMLMVPRERMGTAFGLMSLVQSVGLSGFNFLVGWANDWARAGEGNPDGYRLGMWLFTGSLALGLLFAVWLLRHESGPDGHGLERASGSRRVPAASPRTPIQPDACRMETK